MLQQVNMADPWCGYASLSHMDKDIAWYECTGSFVCTFVQMASMCGWCGAA